MPNFLQTVITIIGLAAIIVAAYYVTYFIASRGARVVNRGASGRAIRILESFSLSKDKGIYSIEVSGRVYIVAMSQGAITVLDSMEKDEYEAPAAGAGVAAEREPIGTGFKSLFKRLGNAAKKTPQVDYEELVNTHISASKQLSDDDIDQVYRKIQSRRQKTGQAEPLTQEREKEESE